MHLAATHKHPAVIQLLADLGAELNPKDKDGWYSNNHN